MPTSLPSAKLSEIEPTAAELADAEKALAEADAKKLRSHKGCMNNFLKNNPDAITSLSDGELQKKYLLNFLVVQARGKNAQKNWQELKRLAFVNCKPSTCIGGVRRK